ncbi:MAG: NAD-dependent epimerase/dehydratase family protein [Bacteroidota bacterium]
MQKDKIIVIGSSGQIGTELVVGLREIYGSGNVIASDIKTPGYEVMEGGPFEFLDVLESARLAEVIKKYHITQVYLLAALLSATAEQNPSFAWKLNMSGLFNVLELAKIKVISKVFWPSSIAVFGPNTPKDNTPQYTITEPDTVYGISKLAGERWCEYFHEKYDVDVRGIRYPGLIGYKSSPGGGTTDYAVHIFHEAINKGSFKCFLSENTTLPMMYMPDAIKATIDLMETQTKNITIRSGYNIHAMSFSPKELAIEITKHVPGFKCSYEPDIRQKFADSWPRSINDEYARKDWGWQSGYDLKRMTEDMFNNLRR